MIAAQNVVNSVILSPATVASNATNSSTVIDTKGFKYAKILVLNGPGTVTTKFATLKVIESDSTSMTSSSDVVAFTGTTNTVTSTSAGFVIPSAASASTQLFEFNIDLRGRKRALQVISQQSSTVVNIAAVCQLSRAETAPDSASEAGVDVRVIG